MGLPIIRHIVALHGGTLLLERREPGGLAATVSLPTGPLSMDLTLSTPGLLVQGKGQLQLLSVTEHRQRHGIPRLMGGLGSLKSWKVTTSSSSMAVMMSPGCSPALAEQEPSSTVAT